MVKIRTFSLSQFGIVPKYYVCVCVTQTVPCVRRGRCELRRGQRTCEFVGQVSESAASQHFHLKTKVKIKQEKKGGHVCLLPVPDGLGAPSTLISASVNIK
jgi:hypothetical protein